MRTKGESIESLPSHPPTHPPPLPPPFPPNSFRNSPPFPQHHIPPPPSPMYFYIAQPPASTPSSLFPQLNPLHLSSEKSPTRTNLILSNSRIKRLWEVLLPWSPHQPPPPPTKPNASALPTGVWLSLSLLPYAQTSPVFPDGNGDGGE